MLDIISSVAPWSGGGKIAYQALNTSAHTIAIFGQSFIKGCACKAPRVLVFEKKFYKRIDLCIM